jgi:transcriptional regulator with XRE-family HTH domain
MENPGGETLLEKISKALSDRNLTKVAMNCGLHENTVRAIASGKNKNPTYETLEKLRAYLFGSSDSTGE